jgi:hypothetical protein
VDMNRQVIEQMERKLIARALKDEGFRKQLLHFPNVARQEVEKLLGVPLPDGFQVRVVQETDNLSYLVVPPVPDNARGLSAAQLEAVASGQAPLCVYGSFCPYSGPLGYPDLLGGARNPTESQLEKVASGLPGQNGDTCWVCLEPVAPNAEDTVWPIERHGNEEVVVLHQAPTHEACMARVSDPHRPVRGPGGGPIIGHWDGEERWLIVPA